MSKLYKFVIELNRELSHEEMNELEIALWAQCEDLRGLQNTQLLEIPNKIGNDVSSKQHSGEQHEPEGSGI